MNNENKNLMIPGAIVLAGIIIAGALYAGGSRSAPSTAPVSPGVVPSTGITMKDVDSSDHVLGKIDSKVVIVEYADLECPYCKQYEPVLDQIMSTYGTSSGKVARVYRHFPIHSRGPYEAEAAECAADQGGNDAFFKFIDRIFTVTKADNNLDPAVLAKTAGEIGLDTKAFQSCLDSGKFKDKIQADYDEAVKAGARGTPYTVLVTKNGKYPLSDSQGNVLGAVGFDDLKAVVDNLLTQTK